ncbi:ADP-ribose glycohydrolase OARD1-like [Lytechinus pictus]|uniref:ADP-ribose glycohydrolase OARD1-like n=1 Tax=Lytechinus pictus TaxID=7653 RepID=UPI0030BA02ED
MDKYLVKKGSSSAGSKVTKVEGNGQGAGESDEVEQAQMSKRRKAGSFILQEVKGDLFAAPQTECLAHCISADVRMGKGIATIFKKKFGGVQDLLAQGVKPGGVAVLQREQRFIYYMVTKEKFWHKPTYKSLQDSLSSMAGHCKENGIKALSMPRIGCGLDGLKWDEVKKKISETFQDMDIMVTIYTL